MKLRNDFDRTRFRRVPLTCARDYLCLRFAPRFSCLSRNRSSCTRAALHDLRTADDGGNLFTADSSAEHIADSIAGLIRTSPAKMRAVASRLRKLADEMEGRIKTARPKRPRP